MEFNLNSLNDYEFECLCKDILERKLDTELYTFSRGRDGGIDICDAKNRPKIIGQAKHYAKSPYSSLLSSLKKEVQRVVRELKPERYFVCTSKSLTRENKKEIYELFRDCMEDISNIIDASVINDFLSKDENADIVRKHYKLWFCASSVLSLISNQSVFIDCEDLFDDVEESVRFFVETNSYREAMKKLVENRILIITGNPGVGKSTLSKMLILRFADEGYDVRYTTDNKVENIKNTLSMNPKKKEIVLLDDFLGQHYLKMRESQPNEIKSLVSFIKRNRNKMLIMNSRITILNEARQQSIAFQEMMEKNEMYTYLLNLDEMSDVEKAEILYNHMFFTSIPREHFEQIKRDERYFKIVYHKNYNPRIIEYVTRPRIYKSVPAEQYFGYIMHKLDEPEDVWRDEFRNRIEEADRILLNILYSLTDTTVSEEILRTAFNSRIRGEGLASSLDIYEDVRVRLDDSMLKNVEFWGSLRVGAMNPSINDFLKSNLDSNTVEQTKIIRSAVYVEQILKVAVTEETRSICREMVLDGTLLEKKTLENSVYYYYLKLVAEFEIYSPDIQENVQNSFRNFYKEVAFSKGEEYGWILLRLMEGDFAEYYGLAPLLKIPEMLEGIIKPLKFDQMFVVLQLVRKKFFSEEEFETVEEIVKDALCREIYADVTCEIDDDLEKIVDREMESCSSRAIDLYQCGKGSALEGEIGCRIQELINDRIDMRIMETDDLVEITTEDFEAWEGTYDFDITGAIDAVFSDHGYMNYYFRDGSQKDSREIIRDIFER